MAADVLRCATVDARREAQRRPSAPALALLLPWLLVALVGDVPRRGQLTDGARDRVGRRDPREHRRARARELRRASAFRARASRASSRSPGRASGARWRSPRWRGRSRPPPPGRDAIHVACATAAIAAGMWIGALLRRPAQAACLVIATIAVVVALYSITQRSFNGEFIAPAFPRLREPLGYANALAALLASGVPTALALGSRRELAARAAAAASICVLVGRADPDRLARRHPRDARRRARRAAAGGTPPRARHHARRRAAAGRARRALRRQPRRPSRGPSRRPPRAPG